MLCRFWKAVTDTAVCFYLILILVVMPFYNREGYRHIGTDKSFFFNQTAVLIGIALLPSALLYLTALFARCRMSLWEKLKRDWSVTDCFAAGYLLALTLSYVCSRYREKALWGAEGWYMGFLPQVFFVLVYFFTAKLWRPRGWVLYLGLAASGVVFALGYLNRFGVDPLGMTTDNPSFLSTVGNINWYCGYLAAVFFAGAALFWLGSGADREGKAPGGRNGERLRLALLALYTAVGFGTLATQGSDSGVITLAVMLLMLFCQSAPSPERMRMFWWEALLLGIVCLFTWLLCRLAPGAITLREKWYGAFLYQSGTPFIVTVVSVFMLLWLERRKRQGSYPKKAFCLLAKGAVFAFGGAALSVLLLAGINTAWPGSIGFLSSLPLFTFSAEWGSYRGATWTAGLRCFAEQDLLHKLVGVGPDAMWAYISTDGSAALRGMVEEWFGTQALTNAHNEWLTALVDTGFLGLLCFGGMMVTGISRFLKKGEENPMAFACGCCLLAHTVNGIFSFQQAMGMAVMSAMFGMGAAFFRENRQ